MKFVSTADNLLPASRRGRLNRWVVFCVWFFGIGSFAFGQGATIVGTVTVPSGSTMSAATITATSAETEQVRSTTIEKAGGYSIPALPPGHYTIRAEAAGFKTAVRKELTLNVGDNVRVDFHLEAGSPKETVTQAGTIKLRSDSGEVSDVITNRQVMQLPVNGRSLYSLAALTPGASSGQADFQLPSAMLGDADISYNGLRQSHNLYMLDGSEIDDRGSGGSSVVLPSLNAIQELRILTSNYGPDYSLASGATLTTVLKSGTKRFHASGWEFTRNDALDARNFFNPSPRAVSELRFHNYGFNAGGQLPAWAAHPTYLFYNMEWRSLIQGGLIDQTVPLASEYPDPVTGDAVFPSSVPVTVPTTVAPSVLARNCPGGILPLGVTPGTQFPANTIPGCMVNNGSSILLNTGIFPKPNSGAQFIGGNNTPTKVREEILRLDHQFNRKFSLFGHAVVDSASQTFGTSVMSGDNVPSVGSDLQNPSYSGVAHLTHIVSPTFVNEVALNFNGDHIRIAPVGVVARPNGFTSLELFSGNNLNRIPGINLNGSTGAAYTSGSWPWRSRGNGLQIRDDVSLSKGAHQIRFGASWASFKKVQDLFGDTQGSFTFQGNFTGNDFADFLLGDAASYTELAVQDRRQWNSTSWAAYVQDNWRVRQRLTLNLGLRWDRIPHTYEANNQVGNFYPDHYNSADTPRFADANGNSISPSSPGLGTSPNPILAGYLLYVNGIGVPGQNIIPKGLVNDHRAIGPRLGLAYDLTGSGKTIVRGGAAVLYERLQGNDTYNAAANVPFTTEAAFNNVTLADPRTSLADGSTLGNIIPVGNIIGLDQSQNKPPVSYQFSAGIQHALSTHSVVSVSYVGNQNRHQNGYREIDLPDASLLAGLTINNGLRYNTQVLYPGYHSVLMSQNNQNSHYNAAQAELRTQMGRDLSLQAAYTYSRAFDSATTANGVADLSTASNPYSTTYDNGPSGLDRTHIAFVNFVYDIPFLKNSENHFLKSAVGGWQIAGVVTAVSGAPLNITESGIAYDPSSGTGNVANVLPNSTNRPNLSGKVAYPKTVAQWFNPSAFTRTAAGEFGNLPFNSVRGPGRQNWNLALFKNFTIRQERGSYVQFRAEAFNVWNHTQFNTVSTAVSFDQTVGSPTNGQINNNFGAVTSAHDPRELQLGVKVFF